MNAKKKEVCDVDVDRHARTDNQVCFEIQQARAEKHPMKPDEIVDGPQAA